MTREIPCSDVIFHTMPLSSLIRSCRFQILLIAVGLGNCLCVLWTILTIESYGKFQVSKLRIIGIEEKYFPVLISIYHRGCANISNLSLVSNDISLPHLVEMSGFSLLTQNMSQEPSKWTRFTLFGSEDNGSNWFVAGASDFRLVRTAPRFLDREIQMDSTREFFADYNVSVLWFLSYLAQPLALGVGLMVSGFCGACLRSAPGVLAFCTSLAVSAALALVASVSQLANGKVRDSFLPGARSFAYVGAAAVLHIAEPFSAELLVAFGFFCLAARVIDDCLIFSDCAYLVTDPPVGELSVAAVGAALLLLRLRFCAATKHATLRVEESQREHSPWLPDTTQLEGQHVLNDVHILADELRRACGEIPVRHGVVTTALASGLGTEGPSKFRRKKRRSSIWDQPEQAYETILAVAPPRDSVGSETGGQPLEEHRRVACLDQLYSQALGLAPALNSLCASWAARSGGRILRAVPPCHAAPSGDGLATHTEVLRGVLTGEVKAPCRAASKALACYDGDVSRVVDICRARIGFDDAAGLLACLGMVRVEAPHVVVCSVKDLLTTSSSPGFPVPN